MRHLPEAKDSAIKMLKYLLVNLAIPTACNDVGTVMRKCDGTSTPIHFQVSDPKFGFGLDENNISIVPSEGNKFAIW